MGDMHPLAMLAIGIVLGVGLALLAVVWVLGEMARRLDDTQIAALFRARSAGAEERRPGPPVVLVVDDDPSVRRVVGEALALEGYDVLEASDGAEALEALRRRRPAAVVLDLVMPRVDGWAFRARQRAEHKLAKIPVVVLTAAAPSPQEAEALGASAVLRKPFQVDALLDAVRRAAGPSAA